MTTDTAAALPPLLTLDQLAKHLDFSYEQVRGLVRKQTFGPKDQLPKLGRSYRIPRHRVEAYCRGDLEGAKA
ncbi:helix-turn-helix domain-containing protein [Actinomycetospora termitidis]|uniref:Helix-turn-helix domain-containing protein n=1 Tax=Actinomycetospora termitidis TaxID=3053470 RepID=A0ABT7MHR2_9PSEU|nr:helix-turn-helix domain-containing protein [Actinomycetospora sp. Odt1-22]MDL5159477.1 helix-turn-helix domain-containing protein [Actinomycetospora sp. Odt1-22]